MGDIFSSRAVGVKHNTSLSFRVNRSSNSQEKIISNFDFEKSRPSSWLWSMGKVTKLAQCPIDLLDVPFTPIRPRIPEYSYFKILLKDNSRSRSWVRSMVKVTHLTQYPTDALMHSYQLDQPSLRYD